MTFLVFALPLATLLLMAWFQYYSFAIPAVDFSIFDQMLANTERGKFMYSAACGAGGCDHFGVHANLILLPLVPLHRIFEHPLFLIITHVIVLWSAAIPLYLLCMEKFPRPWRRRAVVLAFFCSPFFIKIFDYQFHPEVFYVPLFLWFAYFLEKKRWVAFWICCALILVVKEDAPIYVAAAAVGSLLTRRLSGRQAAKLVIASIAVFCLDIFGIIPANSGGGAYRLATTSARYGSTLGEAAPGMFAHLREIALGSTGGVWLTSLFRVAFLPLLEPLFLIAVLPFVAIHSAAQADLMRGLALYYSAPYLPWIFVAFALALGRRWLPDWARDFAVLLALCSSVPAWYPRHFASPIQAHARNLAFERARLSIGAGDSVCAQDGIFPHLGDLEDLELLGPTCMAHGLDHYLFNLDLDYWPWQETQMRQMMAALDARPEYGKSEFGGFVLYSKSRP